MSPQANTFNSSLWKDYLVSLDYRPLFATVSGAHIYGFPSPDSDIDLRGCHQLPLEAIVGLTPPKETIDHTSIQQGIEIDLVSHDIGKYFRLLVKNNGYVLEQIFSPMVVLGKDFLEELKPIAGRCITRFHYHHYRGFYAAQRKLLNKEPTKKAKSLLYAYRVLMTGIHLMKTGRIETDVNVMYEALGLPFIPDLIAMKVTEKASLSSLDWEYHAAQLDALECRLAEAFETTHLPETRDTQSVNDLLVRLRLNGPLSGSHHSQKVTIDASKPSKATKFVT